ncbi:response regulator [Sphingobacterium griseoflavum]|uniref:Response regulatory domain-containing protein n=1 Tax=Sphingobacterium griseoflavum TaxID=1474952 RepID=A0ABQ3I0G8_9SPHI|nr:response regulator [Sphingobacterium griseoflavum]GHE45651.1 hypothetical protein GCM10017764_31140 [Sphingobacterium griseoflavum]
MTIEETTHKKVNIGFAEDSTITQLLLKTLIKQDGRFELILAADHGQMLLEKLETTENRPAVCILDLYMQPGNGIETASLIRERFPKIVTFGYSTSTEAKDISDMEQAGVIAVFDKNKVSVAELLNSIHAYLASLDEN